MDIEEDYFCNSEVNNEFSEIEIKEDVIFCESFQENTILLPILKDKGEVSIELNDASLLENDHQHLFEEEISFGQLVDELIVQLIGNKFSCEQIIFD